MSLTRDPRALVNLPEEVLRALPPNPEIVKLGQRREKLRARAHRIKGKAIKEEVRRLIIDINNAKVKW